MTDYRREIEQAVKQFRRTAEKISMSDHPRYKVEGTREYEIRELREQLDAKVTELREAYEKALAEEIKHAEAAAVKSRFPVSTSDKETVEHIAQAFIADVKLALSDAEKGVAFDAMERKLDGMNEGALAYMRLQLPRIMDAVGEDAAVTRRLRSLNVTLSGLKTPEQERLEALKQERVSGIDSPYRRLRMTHSAYGNLRENQHYGRL